MGGWLFVWLVGVFCLFGVVLFFFSNVVLFTLESCEACVKRDNYKGLQNFVRLKYK